MTANVLAADEPPASDTPRLVTGASAAPAGVCTSDAAPDGKARCRMGALGWFALGGAVTVVVGVLVWYGIVLVLVVDDMERRFYEGTTGKGLDDYETRNLVPHERSGPGADPDSQRPPVPPEGTT